MLPGRIALPLGMLDDHAVAIMILKRASKALPVRVVRRHFVKACSDHRPASALPGRPLRNVKHKQVFRRGGGYHSVGPAEGELQVITGTWGTEHHPIKPFVVGETAKLQETEARFVLRDSTTEIVDGACDSQMNAHGVRAGVVSALNDILDVSELFAGPSEMRRLTSRFNAIFRTSAIVSRRALQSGDQPPGFDTAPRQTSSVLKEK